MAEPLGKISSLGLHLKVIFSFQIFSNVRINPYPYDRLGFGKLGIIFHGFRPKQKKSRKDQFSAVFLIKYKLPWVGGERYEWIRLSHNHKKYPLELKFKISYNLHLRWYTFSFLIYWGGWWWCYFRLKSCDMKENQKKQNFRYSVRPIKSFFLQYRVIFNERR